MSNPTDPDLIVDGRLARGARRRAEIIDKTIEVVEREGIAGVSHRRIAGELDVSPSALTHHFATLDDLLTAALTTAVVWTEVSFDDLETLDDLVDHLTGQMNSEPRRLIAIYELYLQAARRPALREAARGWVESLRSIARRLGTDRDGELALVTAVDGLGLLALLSEGDLPRDTVHQVLSRALRLPS